MHLLHPASQLILLWGLFAASTDCATPDKVTLQLSWKESDIRNASDVNGKKVAVWLAGNELGDRIIVKDDWIKSAKNQDIAVRFLRASIKG